jgi:hypothetical protein
MAASRRRRLVPGPDAFDVVRDAARALGLALPSRQRGLDRWMRDFRRPQTRVHVSRALVAARDGDHARAREELALAAHAEAELDIMEWVYP